MSNSKTLCILPWLHRFTSEQGFHQICCSGEGPRKRLRDKDGHPLHINQALTDEELLNSPDLKAIRIAMLNEEWPSACERCRRSEEAGAKSVRQYMNDRFQHHWPEVLEQTVEDGTLSNPRVRYADIRLGNVCNLTCRMCGPGASRLWSDHYNEVQPPRFRILAAQLEDMKVNNWVKRQPARWLIEQCISSVEALQFAGGEPFIIPEMIEMLEVCVDSGRADQIALSYHTNLTVLPEKVTRLWPHFRSVTVICSVDGVGPLNEYIRRPSKWSDVDQNLHKLDAHCEEWNLRKIQFNTTVQIYNILSLADFFDYMGDNFKHVGPVPTFSPLYQPNYLSIANLPDDVKQIASDRLLSARSKAITRYRGYIQLTSVDTIIALMQKPSHPNGLKDFLYFTEKTDHEFKDSWARSCPELYDLLMRR